MRRCFIGEPCTEVSNRRIGADCGGVDTWALGAIDLLGDGLNANADETQARRTRWDDIFLIRGIMLPKLDLINMTGGWGYR